jgi:hypothetical protein
LDGASSSALRIAAGEEGGASDLGGVFSLDLINAFATNRTKPNTNPPTPFHIFTGAGTSSQLSMGRVRSAIRMLRYLAAVVNRDVAD